MLILNYWHFCCVFFYSKVNKYAHKFRLATFFQGHKTPRVTKSCINVSDQPRSPRPSFLLRRPKPFQCWPRPARPSVVVIPLEKKTVPSHKNSAVFCYSFFFFQLSFFLFPFAKRALFDIRSAYFYADFMGSIRLPGDLPRTRAWILREETSRKKPHWPTDECILQLIKKIFCNSTGVRFFAFDCFEGTLFLLPLSPIIRRNDTRLVSKIPKFKRDLWWYKFEMLNSTDSHRRRQRLCFMLEVLVDCLVIIQNFFKCCSVLQNVLESSGSHHLQAFPLPN